MGHVRVNCAALCIVPHNFAEEVLFVLFLLSPASMLLVLMSALCATKGAQRLEARKSRARVSPLRSF